MRKARKALYWFGLVLGVTLFAWQLIGVFRSLLTNTLPVRSIGSLVASWAALVILVYMQMMNWRLILSGSGHRLNMRGLVRGCTLSFLAGCIPGWVWGDISRGEWMQQTYQVPFNVINFSSI